ncbi:hypothetical protein [Escherichia coli]|uniref:hypothetical protein n=1 Tax=Escherichia coli TaxID=562 RepID=UPI00388D0493
MRPMNRFASVPVMVQRALVAVALITAGIGMMMLDAEVAGGEQSKPGVLAFSGVSYDEDAACE